MRNESYYIYVRLSARVLFVDTPRHEAEICFAVTSTSLTLVFKAHITFHVERHPPS
jgi:hypothetical protein